MTTPCKTPEDWAELIREMDEDDFVLTQLRSQIFVHYRNYKRCVFVSFAQLQLEDKRQSAVIYREEGKSKLFVRPTLEFTQKFRQVGAHIRITKCC